MISSRLTIQPFLFLSCLNRNYEPMKRYLIIPILFMVGCNSDDVSLKNICAVENPTEELTWLREAIEELSSNTSELRQYFFVSQGEYQNQTVFIFDNCCPFCNTVVQVMNCEGEVLGNLSDNIDPFSISNKQIIWKPSDFNCN